MADKTRIKLWDGREGYKYPSGAIKDLKGRFLVAHQPGAARRITRYNSSEFHKKKSALRSAAVQAAIINGTASVDIAGGIENLTNEIVSIITSNDAAPRDKIQAFKELMRFGGLADDLTRGGSAAPGAYNGGSALSGEAIEALNTILPILERRLKDQNREIE